MNQTLNVVLFAKSEIPQMGLKRIGVLYNEQKMIDNKRKSVLDISIQDCKELAANNILDKEILKRNKMDCKTPEEENYFLSELQKKEEIENAWGNKITVKIDLDKLPDPEEDPWQNLKSGSTRENKTGLFGDTLTEDEVSVSEKAYNLLRREHFKFKKGTEKKLEKIFPLKPNPERTLSEMNEVKSTLFEIRFLAELFRRGAKNIEYEFKTGIGDTDVDFKCSDSQNNTWLIELTSLRESEHIKSKTYQNGDLYGCDYDEIGTEELVIRAQRRLIEKTYNNKTCLPIKFPEVTNANTYNVIAIDMKSYLLSSDDYDYYLICYGNSEKILAAKVL